MSSLPSGLMMPVSLPGVGAAAALASPIPLTKAGIGIFLGQLKTLKQKRDRLFNKWADAMNAVEAGIPPTPTQWLAINTLIDKVHKIDDGWEQIVARLRPIMNTLKAAGLVDEAEVEAAGLAALPLLAIPGIVVTIIAVVAIWRATMDTAAEAESIEKTTDLYLQQVRAQIQANPSLPIPLPLRSSPSSIGSIVGGLGGMVGLGLAGLALFMLMRRRAA